MERSEKEQLLEEIRVIVREETSPVLDILMAYLDVQFEILDEKYQGLFDGIAEVLERLTEMFGR
jgi:hypothetical protein